MTQHINRVRTLTKLLDNQFNIFGIKIGIDPIIGLFPVLGDLIPAALSLYMVWIAFKLNAPLITIAIMLINIVLDFVIGLIPIVGDVLDIVYKSNLRNLELLERHLLKM